MSGDYTLHGYKFPAGNGYVSNGTILSDCCTSRLGPQKATNSGVRFRCCSTCNEPIVQISSDGKKQLLNGRAPGCGGTFRTIEGNF